MGKETGPVYQDPQWQELHTPIHGRRPDSLPSQPKEAKGESIELVLVESGEVAGPARYTSGPAITTVLTNPDATMASTNPTINRACPRSTSFNRS